MECNPNAINGLGFPIELLSRIFEFGHGGGRNENRDSKRSRPHYWDRVQFKFHPLEQRAGSCMFNDHIQVVNVLLSSSSSSLSTIQTPSFRNTICLVCRHWHRVAISTPALWTTLRLYEWDSFEWIKDILVLARSGSLPLHIDVWRYMEIDSVEDHSTSNFSEEELEEMGVTRPLPRLAKKYITLFDDIAPRVRSTNLTCSRLSWSEPWISSLSNLITLDLRDPDRGSAPLWTQFAFFLRCTPALRQLVLFDAGLTTPLGGEVVGGVVPLLNLTDLVLQEESADCAEGLLRILYMPALKTLSLEVPYEGDYTQFLHLLAGPATVLATPPAAA